MSERTRGFGLLAGGMDAMDMMLLLLSSISQILTLLVCTIVGASTPAMSNGSMFALCAARLWRGLGVLYCLDRGNGLVLVKDDD